MPSLAGDIGLFITRLFFGLSMTFAHGLKKLPPSDGWINFVGELGFPSPLFFAWCAGLTKFIGGLLVAVGFCTRGAATLLTLTMWVAVFLGHAGDPFKKMELGLCYGTVYLLLIVLGPGRLSIDRVWSSRKR